MGDNDEGKAVGDVVGIRAGDGPSGEVDLPAIATRHRHPMVAGQEVEHVARAVADLGPAKEAVGGRLDEEEAAAVDE